MRSAIRIPQAGTSTEAMFLEWNVTVGQSVTTGDLLGTAETDKVVLEITADQDGVIDELLAQPDQDIDISEPLGYLSVADQAGVSDEPVTVQSDETSDEAEVRCELPSVRRRTAINVDWVTRNTAISWIAVTVDYEAVHALRRKWKEEFRTRTDASLTYLPFVAAAVCQCLPNHEAITALIDLERQEWIVQRQVNLGISVAVDSGLYVPVLANAGALPFFELAQAMVAAADRVRQQTLLPGDLQGSTFTITNPGGLGTVLSMPIMNKGETAILAVDAIEQRAVVTDGMITARRQGNLGLSFDHRVVDGVEATAFLMDVKQRLETGAFAWP